MEDPSGFFFNTITDKINSYIYIAAAVVVAVVATVTYNNFKKQNELITDAISSIGEAIETQ